MSTVGFSIIEAMVEGVVEEDDEEEESEGVDEAFTTVLTLNGSMWRAAHICLTIETEKIISIPANKNSITNRTKSGSRTGQATM